MLKNEKYMGTLIYNRGGSKPRPHKVLIDHFEEVRTEDAIPPIITAELFDQVQKVMKNRSAICPRSNTSNYLLTGVLYCKHCGSSMSGNSYRGGRDKRSYRGYQCTTSAKDKTKCKTKPLNADSLERTVKNAITSLLNEMVQEENAASRLRTVFDESVKNEIANLKHQITELESKGQGSIERALGATSQDAIELYEQKAAEYSETKRTKEALLSKLEQKTESVKQMIADIETKKATLTVDAVFSTPVISREWINLFVDRIEVDDAGDDITIALKV